MNIIFIVASAIIGAVFGTLIWTSYTLNQWTILGMVVLGFLMVGGSCAQAFALGTKANERATLLSKTAA